MVLNAQHPGLYELYIYLYIIQRVCAPLVRQVHTEPAAEVFLTFTSRLEQTTRSYKWAIMSGVEPSTKLLLLCRWGWGVSRCGGAMQNHGCNASGARQVLLSLFIHISFNQHLSSVQHAGECGCRAHSATHCDLQLQHRASAITTPSKAAYTKILCQPQNQVKLNSGNNQTLGQRYMSVEC